MRAASEPRLSLEAATARPAAAVHGGRRRGPWIGPWIGSWIGPTGALAALVLIATLGVAAAQPAEPIAIPLEEASPLDTSQPPLEGDWVVAAAVGEANWRPQGSGRWQPIAIGRVLPAPSEIETGATGGVTLVLGGDRLVVASSSRLILMARARGEDQRLRQERGRLRVDIEQRPGRAVEVRTPLLSLGIKGTSFEVAVDRWQSSIVVLEGQVTVSTPSGAPVRLGPRQGLRQPADPDRPASRLELTDLSPVSRTGPVRWQLPTPASPSVADLADPSTAGTPGSTVLTPGSTAGAPGSTVLLTPGSTAGAPGSSVLPTPGSTAGAPGSTAGAPGSTVLLTPGSTAGAPGSTVLPTPGSIAGAPGSTVLLTPGSTAGAPGSTALLTPGSTAGAPGSTALLAPRSIAGAPGSTALLAPGSTAGAAGPSALLTPGSTAGAPGSTALAPPGSTAGAPGSTGLGAPVAQARPPAPGWLSAWLDDDRIALTLVLVVAAGLVLLIVPGLALGQHLRQQWLDRPTGKGKRRRSLIRGC